MELKASNSAIIMSADQNKFLLNLLQLPQHILKNSHTSGMVDLILGHLASKECFNLKKAAYLLDNPEFNCTRGICGVETCGLEEVIENPWNCVEEAINQVSNQEFNKKIKCFTTNSLKNKKGKPCSEEEIIEFGRKHLELENPMFIEWTGRHGNHGLLFCEPLESASLEEKMQFLKDTAVLLGITHH